MAKTLEQIEELKRQWRTDPCFDIEDADGFEDYREDLIAYRLQYEQDLANKVEARHNYLASLVCPQTFAGHAYKGDFGQDQFELHYQNCLVEKCAWWNKSIVQCGAISRVS